MSDRPDPAVLLAPSTQSSKAHSALVEHALRRHSLLTRHLAKHAQHSMTTAAMLSQLTQPQTWQELCQIQEAIMQQTYQLQQNWISDWNAWLGEFAQIKQANTMSKLVEQEFNLVGQFVRLLQNQATDWVGLLENVEVNYGYWLSEKSVPDGNPR